MNLLQKMIGEFNDGKSHSFYCIAATLFPIEDVQKSILKTKNQIKTKHLKNDDIKMKADNLKKIS